MLDRLHGIADELIAKVRSLLDKEPAASLLPDNVVAAVEQIPSIAPEERTTVMEGLSRRRGTINLGSHSKKDAALIVQHLHDLLTSAGLPLTTEERKVITIQCTDASFRWYGPGPRGGKSRDQAKHISTQITIKPSPLVEVWMKNHPK